jgi:prohibitin 1
MDVRTTPRTIKTVTGTKDLQKVNLSLRVLSRPSVPELAKIYKDIGPDYAERVLPSVGNEVLKAVVARYNADQLLTKRDKISLEIREALTKRCQTFNIEVDDVSITDLNFSRDFSRAIEDKQVAEQNAERAKFMVAKAEQEKQAVIIRSKGDAEAAELVSKALATAGTGLIELRRIDAAQSVAQTLARSRANITYLPRGGNMLLNLNTDSKH